MENRNVVIKPDNMEVVDGRVIISSEELAAAIQDCDVDLTAGEEEAGFVLNFCIIKA